MLQIPGSPFFYVPVFTNSGQLKTLMAKAGTPFDSIKEITDGADFMTSFPNDVKVMHNPYFTPEGRVRWTEVLQD